MKKSIKIVVNGQEYDSVDHMPPEVRKQYLAVIDSLRHMDQGDARVEISKPKVTKTQFFTYMGKNYNSREELPPEARELLKDMPDPVIEDETDPIKPDEVKATIQVSTSRVTKLLDDTLLENDRSPVNTGSGFSRILLWLLGAAVLVILYFWLKGIRPSSWFGN
jgi:hypothetical protein